MKLRSLFAFIVPLLSSAALSVAAVPVISSVTPAFGPIAGATSVTVTGTGFTGATAVVFGSTAAASFTVNSDTSITATSPAGAKGTIHLSVTTAGGTNTAAAGDQFTYTSGSLIIREFRVRGPNGANDEYIQIYNPTGVAHTVVAASGTGYGVAASDGTTRFSIPNGTVIPAYGHFLGVNSVGYSLASYPAGNGTTATGDATYTTDIPDNAGIALFNNNTGGGSYTLANRLDAVGSTSEANTLYKEGTGYAALVPFSIDYCFHRICQQSPATATITDTTVSLGDGQPRDTDNNSTDFIFEDTNGTSAGAGQRLGAPGPQNLSSPSAGYPMVATNLSRALLDPESALGVSPNRVKDTTSLPASNATFGTLDFRRTFTNNTGGNITRLRFRILKLTTFPAPSGTSDLRPRTSTDVVVGATTVRGTTLEQPPSQPNGGGFNSSLSVNAVTLGSPLANGASISVRFLFGIQQTGNFRFLIVAEGLPGPLSQLWYVSGDTTSTADTETIGNAPSIGSPTSASVAATTVTLGGNVTSDGGATITERGIVYSVTSTNADPLISGTGVTKVAGTGTTGVFTVDVTGLTAGTAYSYKAYATNGVATTYTTVGTFTTVSNNANLSALALSSGTLSPVFAQGTTSYTASVANSVTSLTATPTVAQSGATVKVNNVTVASGSPSGSLSLNVGSNTVTVVVTAPDAVTTKTYTVTVTRLGSPVLGATLTASGTFVAGTNVTYTATLTNTGTATQADNSGNEFTLVLPAGLTLVSASASSGTSVATIGTNTVTWNGSIAASASVTVTITATINLATVGAVSAQGTVNYDADLNNTNESSALTDDPGVVGAANATVFTALSPNHAPTFEGSTTALNVTQNSLANDLKSLLHATDVDSAQTLTWSVAEGGAPAHGTLTITSATATSGTDVTPGGTLTYTPANGYFGADSFTVAVSDGSLAATRTISVTVAAVPVPVISSALTATGTYGTAFTTYTITASNTPTSYSATGLPAGLSINAETGAITGTPTQAGSFDVTLGAANAGGTGNATLAITIAKKTLTITGVSASDKIYDGAVSATLITTNAALSGVVGEDVVTLVKTGATATFADAAVGSAKPVTVSGFALTGAAADNYALTQPAGLTAAITAAPQAITFTAPSGKLTTDAAFTLSATSSVGLPITYTIVSGPAMLSGNTVTLTGASGWVVIRASQAGNSSYGAATDVTQQFYVSAVGPQIFFGHVGSAPAAAGPQARTAQTTVSVAVNLAKDNSSGTLIGYLATTGQGFVLNFTPDSGGAFSGTAQVYASDTATASSLERSTRSVTSAEGSILAGTFTINGTVLNGTVSGTIVQPAVTFSATMQPQTGPTADLAGYYIAPSTNTASGSTFVIVDANNSVFVLAVTPKLVTAGTGTSSAAGALSATLGTSTFAGTINATTTIVASSLTIPGTGDVTFGGVKSSTLRTDRLVNLSARAPSGPGEKVLITGFVIGGSSAKRVLLRGVGPTLQSQGVNVPLANPQLKLFTATGTLIASNDDWSDPAVATAATLTGAFALPTGSKDAAIIATLQPGAYTLQAGDASGATGVALAEIYDATENPQADYQRLINISARGQVSTGENVLFGGFVVTGNSPKRVLIRGVGPALTPLGVGAALADPMLKVYKGITVIAQNDNWETPVAISASQTAASAASITEASVLVGAFALPAGSKDAALIVTLAPGVYSASVAGVGTATGIALIEVYEIP